MKPSFPIISSDLTCSFLLEEERLPPSLGGRPQRAEISGGPDRGLGERGHEFDGLPLGSCNGFLSAVPPFCYVIFFFCLEPSAAVAAQGSSGHQESAGSADTSAPGLLRSCVLFHLLPTDNVLEDWMFTSASLVLSDSFNLFRETLPVVKINLPEDK